MRKEIVEDEDYLGIKINRFYWKWKRCSGELTMKTDPKNSDYVWEYGATRNYEPWRDIRAAEAANSARKKLDEANDMMKILENKTYDSKREMDILDNLEEVKQMNKRHAKVDIENVIEANRKKYLNNLQEDVLEKDAKESYNKLIRKRADLLEQDRLEEQQNQELSDSEDDEEGLGSIMNVKKREMKQMIKILPKDTNKFVKKEPNHDKKNDVSVSNAFTNPLLMYSSESESDNDD